VLDVVAALQHEHVALGVERVPVLLRGVATDEDCFVVVKDPVARGGDEPVPDVVRVALVELRVDQPVRPRGGHVA